MNLRECPFEAEVMAAVRAGQWPNACDPALRAHVSECRRCDQAAMVSTVLGFSREVAMSQAGLSAPGLLFWKAQLRRRREALERLHRPVLAIEIAGALVSLVVLALIAWRWVEGSGEQVISGALSNWSFPGSGWNWTVLAAGLASLVMFGGVALYLAMSKE